MGRSPRYIINLSESYREDEELVGKKARELGILWKLGIPLPKGFVITTEFYNEFPHFPQELSIILHEFYRQLAGFKEQSITIFSSTSNNKSILFSNVKGDANLILKIKEIYSLNPDKPVAIIVQENINFTVKGKTATDSPPLDKNLTDAQTQRLINHCKTIQKHFYFPKEVEYGVKNNNIFITKVNPFTGKAMERVKQTASKRHERKIITKGIPVGPGIVTGIVKVVNGKQKSAPAKENEIAVLSNLTRDLLKKIKNAKAVIADSNISNTDRIIFRKSFQIPAVFGAKNATKTFKNGNVITINGINGEIYSGGLQ